MSAIAIQKTISTRQRTDEVVKIGGRRSAVECTRVETSLDKRRIWNLATFVSRFSPVKRNKVEMCLDERMLAVNWLFCKNDEQPNKLTDAQIMQLQMKEFNRLLAKGQNETVNYILRLWRYGSIG